MVPIRTFKLSRRKIFEVNESLIDFFYHPLGGEFIKGSVLATMYEKHHQLFDHGYDDTKWYKLHVAESPRGSYVMISETSNPNVFVEQKK